MRCSIRLPSGVFPSAAGEISHCMMRPNSGEVGIHGQLAITDKHEAAHCKIKCWPVASRSSWVPGLQHNNAHGPSVHVISANVSPHGYLQGNRFMGLALHAKALELNLRILTPDRPGFGRSTPQPDRTVLQYPEDVAQLCDQLHIDRHDPALHCSAESHTSSIA